MNVSFKYKENKLFCENLVLTSLVKRFGSPLYVYSKAQLKYNYIQFSNILKSLSPFICYSLKANANLYLLKELVKMGCGADVVSAGELLQALKAGFSPEKIVLAGVGKRRDEIKLALQKKIKLINIESAQELEIVQEEAEKLNHIVNISFRINPNVNANTHPYISTGMVENKFGVEEKEALFLYQKAKHLSHVRPIGIHVHIGSQIRDMEPFQVIAQKVVEWISLLKALDIQITHVDFGGGLGVNYEEPLENTDDLILQNYTKIISDTLKETGCTFLLEPGRFLVANTAVLLTEVLYTKGNSRKCFAVVDAGMTDLIRPSLYNSYHAILPTTRIDSTEIETYDVVGPICESSDFIAKDRVLSLLHPGDILAIMTTGAYGYVQSSNYNLRGRPAEVLVDRDQAVLIREREVFG